MLVTLKDIIKSEGTTGDDLPAFEALEAWLLTESVRRVPAARALMNIVQRAKARVLTVSQEVTTASLLSELPLNLHAVKPLKLLEIPPQEMARQLTLMESYLFRRATSTEFIQVKRTMTSQKQKTSPTGLNHVRLIIETSNKVCRLPRYRVEGSLAERKTGVVTLGRSVGTEQDKAS